MFSASSSFSGLSTASIAALFGTPAPTSGAATEVGAKTAAGATMGTPITGAAAGTNAAKAIQTIVTQIQIEKRTQTSAEGKISTLSLASASATYGAAAEVNSNPQTIDSGTTVLDSVTTVTADNTDDAAATLMSQVKAQETVIEAAQGGVLMTKDEIAYGGLSVSNNVTWTANSVTIATKGVANQGVELYEEEGALGAPSYFNEQAQKFETSPATSPAATSAPTTGPSADAAPMPASAGTDSDTSSASGTGSALYLSIWIYHGYNNDGYNVFDAKEQQIVSDFENGALAGQNGTAPEGGAGFSMSWMNNDESAYNISGVMMSNTDATAVADKSITAPLGQIQQNASMGGTVVSENWDCTDGSISMGLVIPLKRS